MSTSEHIDRICIAAVVASLLISVLFMNGAALGIQANSKAMEYETRLFDTGKVHSIDILIDDWEGFLKTAQSEEYAVCDVVIDGEAFSNVGIRGKGNTSLSTVSSMDSERYSFKIEFDQYDSTKSYYGLDKLSLNNLIQDNTMMKDYLTYQMMNEFGVAAPLCSYVYITVNGEDWGLYLAVEAVEESFLRRNYGSNYGDLYKPDSMNMGGGRGNGKDFQPEDFADSSQSKDSANITTPSDSTGGMQGDHMRPGMDGGESGRQPGDMGGSIGGQDSSDVKLQYTDDSVDSYANIFDNAKTDISSADRQRLIAALKTLSEKSSLESAVNTDAVIRYFVVHNYVVNGDSYTGSMVHNYYLYEENGQFSMIPWDYNLAYGTFQGNQASAAVNDDIDSPLSVTGSDRPMIDWIYASEEYTQVYHQSFQEFLNTVDAGSIITQASELIAPYVQKDPTKFCTYEEFDKGVQTLKSFCELRSQSVLAQLAGEDWNVDTSGINLSDMGTMNHGMDGGHSQMPGNSNPEDIPQNPGGSYIPGAGEVPEGGQFFPGMGGQGGMQQPGVGQLPGGMEQTPPGADQQMPGSITGTGQSDMGNLQIGNLWLTAGITLVILVAGLLFALRYRP